MKIRISKVLNRVSPHFFYLPSFLLLFIFVIYPMFSQFYWGFFEWGGFGEATFVGLQNYINIFKSISFIESLKNNLIFFLAVFIIQNLLCISIAIILGVKIGNKLLIIKGGIFFRVIFFISFIISAIVVAVIFGFILKDNGTLNEILGLLRLNFLQNSWLGNYKIVIYTVSMVYIWANFGYYMLIYYAGLMLIPGKLNEAAEIDGANLFQRIRYIMLPLLKPSFIIVSVLTFIDAFRVFELVYVMTRGGPGDASSVISIVIIRHILYYLKFGFGAAISSFMTIFVFIITIFYLRFITKGKMI